ncbi:unnamed protein product [Hymenolepis diminuta]|uniref:LEM domain-containing protein n=1 Tax=Hymenolepis diminuta TaxID=6216 RepID=A0A158QG30_HYMDI|nr:unnamed protein product [Hymenolepis diminuta]
MDALSPKQRLIMMGMKCNSLPKIAKVNVEERVLGRQISAAHSENMENKSFVTSPLPASANGERVQRAHSLYTIPATDSNEYRSNPLVNLRSSHTSRTTRMEYDILDPSEEASPATPSISVSELATGPGSKVYWRIGMVVMASLFLFVLLTIIILGVYFVKRYVVLSVELVLTF